MKKVYVNGKVLKTELLRVIALQLCRDTIKVYNACCSKNYALTGKVSPVVE